MEAPADLEQLLDGLHEWRDVQGVIGSTFQALYGVAHAQSHSVREVERKFAEVHRELEASLSQKADSSELRAAYTTAGNARLAADLVGRRFEEEVQCARDAQRIATEEAQALRSGLTELRTSLEKQRADVQQWRTGLEAGLARLAAECASAAQNVQTECRAALQSNVDRLEETIEERFNSLAAALKECREEFNQEMDNLGATINDRTSSWNVVLERASTERSSSWESVVDEKTQELAAALNGRTQKMQSAFEERVASLMTEIDKKTSSLSAALAEKASADQLREIIREAWQREETQFMRLQRLCESKASANEFATLTALADGKASLADVEAAVQRHLRKRLVTMAAEQQALSRAEVSNIAEEVAVDMRHQLQQCELRNEELARKQQRMAEASDWFRVELRNLATSKLERAEAEALVAGALADWVRAAQRGAEAVQAAFDWRTSVSHTAAPSIRTSPGLHSPIAPRSDTRRKPQTADAAAVEPCNASPSMGSTVWSLSATSTPPGSPVARTSAAISPSEDTGTACAMPFEDCEEPAHADQSLVPNQLPLRGVLSSRSSSNGGVSSQTGHQKASLARFEQRDPPGSGRAGLHRTRSWDRAGAAGVRLRPRDGNAPSR